MTWKCVLPSVHHQTNDKDRELISGPDGSLPRTDRKKKGPPGRAALLFRASGAGHQGAGTMATSCVTAPEAGTVMFTDCTAYPSAANPRV